MPELLDDARHRGARAVVLEPVIDRSQAEVDAQVVDEVLGLESERIERRHDLVAIARVVEELAPLLDDGARQGLREAALRQNELDRVRCLPTCPA